MAHLTVANDEEPPPPGQYLLALQHHVERRRARAVVYALHLRDARRLRRARGLGGRRRARGLRGTRHGRDARRRLRLRAAARALVCLRVDLRPAFRAFDGTYTCYRWSEAHIRISPLFFFHSPATRQNQEHSAELCFAKRRTRQRAEKVRLPVLPPFGVFCVEVFSSTLEPPVGYRTGFLPIRS